VPLETTVTERTVLVAGEGDVVRTGMSVAFDYLVYNATTGDQLGGYDDTGTVTGTVSEAQMIVGMVKTLECSTVGSRVVAIVPPIDAFGADGPNVGIGETDSLIFVFDIKEIAPEPSEAPDPSLEPLPTPAAWVDNVPTVDLSGEVPVVTLPKTAPAENLQLKVITEGTGAEVSPASTVTVDYQGISWDANEIFDQSYTRGEPSAFPVGGVIKGFAAAMVGQKVGATVLVTIPPTYAYGEGEINDQNLAGQTLVFLIQIRDVT
jgi:peptidylprolyl isomerase